MGRVESQEEIINKIKQKYFENGDITEDDVYHILTDYGFSDEDRQVRVKKHRFGLKSSIIDKNIIYPEDYHFVPFSYEGESLGGIGKEVTQNMVKMYIPMDAKNLKNAYHTLSDFVRKNKIISNNKARNRATNDDIVIRVTSSKDALAVKSFINNNSDLRNGIKKANPFLAQDELGIGYSMDGNYSSVNGVLASSLREYVKSNPNTANRDGFKAFLNNKKTEYYLENYPLYMAPSDEKIRIKNLIGMSMDEDFNYIDMLNYFNLIKTNHEILGKIRYMDACDLVHRSIMNKNEFNEVVRIMSDIENAKKNEFDHESVYYLSKAFLNNDILRASIINRNNMNNKKFS
ncbi:MAG: hypothetical protein IKE73_03620 [Bacilli bacterium]|nr:hypothetical protein [Bacilli bacterium]